MSRNTTSESKKTAGQRMGFFRLDKETYSRLERLAQRDDRTVSAVVRVAIREYLDRHRAA